MVGDTLYEVVYGNDLRLFVRERTITRETPCFVWLNDQSWRMKKTRLPDWFGTTRQEAVDVFVARCLQSAKENPSHASRYESSAAEARGLLKAK